MLANPALSTAPGMLAVPHRAVAPWAAHHGTFRGTRIITAAALLWTGAILLAFGALVVPAAHDAGRAQSDAGLMGLLGNVAPWLAVLGAANVAAAAGAVRDRRWWLGLTTWLLAAGVLTILSGATFAVAGRDPLALTAADGASPAGQGLGILAWTLGLQGIAAWGVRRIGAARGLA